MVSSSRSGEERFVSSNGDRDGCCLSFSWRDARLKSKEVRADFGFLEAAKFWSFSILCSLLVLCGGGGAKTLVGFPILRFSVERERNREGRIGARNAGDWQPFGRLVFKLQLQHYARGTSAIME